jgi:hypothetical protein
LSARRHGRSKINFLPNGPWCAPRPALTFASGLSLDDLSHSSSARSVIYLGGVNLTGLLTVLAGYAAGGTPVMLAGEAILRATMENLDEAGFEGLGP